MKSFKIIAIGFIPLLFLISGCSNPTNSEIDETISLGYNQSVVIEANKINISFESVVTESRCPDDPAIRCFWEGLAEIRLKVEKPGRLPEYIVLAISGFTTAVDSNRYPGVNIYDMNIQLVQLDPYPDQGRPYPYNEYVASFKITDLRPPPVHDGSVILTDINATAIQLDQFSLNSFIIEGDDAIISVSYGGGCRDHYFSLYMSPASFMESDPVQANLFLRHMGNDDMCEAYITEELRFDLTPIADLFRQTYDPGGTIQLNLFEYFDSVPSAKISAMYYVNWPED
jgi:hypothetical protein